MMPAGSWQRPAYYGDPTQRTACIQAEVEAVRRGVGIIDVSTLGGIELRGPDAPEFMNRLYTFGFVKQPIGKTRYAVLTNEQGVVADDGVAARLGEHHYYVTATSSGVDRCIATCCAGMPSGASISILPMSRVHSVRSMSRGPLSRQVIESVGCSVDLSADTFPISPTRKPPLQASLHA